MNRRNDIDYNSLHNNIRVYTQLIRDNNTTILTLFEDYFTRLRASENAIYTLLNRQMNMYETLIRNVNNEENNQNNNELNENITIEDSQVDINFDNTRSSVQNNVNMRNSDRVPNTIRSSLLGTPINRNNDRENIRSLNTSLPPLNVGTSVRENIQSTMNTPLLSRRDSPMPRTRGNMIRRDTQSIFNIVSDALFNTDVDNGDSFFDPVPIVPTLNQIQSATLNTTFVNIVNPQNTVCSFSLETFQPDTSVTQIIYCGHIFNPISLSRWFEQSSRCPLCRFDIRNYTSRTMYPRREMTFSPPLYSRSNVSQPTETEVEDSHVDSLFDQVNINMTLDIPITTSVSSTNPFDNEDDDNEENKENDDDDNYEENEDDVSGVRIIRRNRLSFFNQEDNEEKKEDNEIVEEDRREECKYDIIEDVESSYENMDINEGKYNEIDSDDEMDSDDYIESNRS